MMMLMSAFNSIPRISSVTYTQFYSVPLVLDIAGFYPSIHLVLLCLLTNIARFTAGQPMTMAMMHCCLAVECFPKDNRPELFAHACFVCVFLNKNVFRSREN